MKGAMKRNSWILAVSGFALALLVVNVIYMSANNQITGRVVDEVDDPMEGIVKVRISDVGYSPDVVRISVGESVAWLNDDVNQHTVTSVSGEELNSMLLSEGEIFSHTFNEVGVFEYACRLHPQMVGRVVVELV